MDKELKMKVVLMGVEVELKRRRQDNESGLVCTGVHLI